MPSLESEIIVTGNWVTNSQAWQDVQDQLADMERRDLQEYRFKEMQDAEAEDNPDHGDG